MADNTLRQIRANRRRRRMAIEKADAELPSLVRAAFAAKHSWDEIAEALGGLTKQRVYQIRSEGIDHERRGT